MVKTLILASALMSSTAFANTLQQKDTDFSKEVWTQSINSVFVPQVARGMEKWKQDPENAKIAEKNRFVEMQVFKFYKAIRYTEVWNDIIKKYPETKNGIIAMCEFGKQELVVPKNKECNDKFIPDVKYMKAQLVPTLANDPRIQTPSIPKNKSPSRTKL